MAKVQRESPTPDRQPSQIGKRDIVRQLEKDFFSARESWKRQDAGVLVLDHGEVFFGRGEGENHEVTGFEQITGFTATQPCRM